MAIRHLLVGALALGLLAACSNEIEVSPAAPKVGASPEVQEIGAEIDEMLAMPQDEYPGGNDFSAAFDELFAAVIEQERSLRTHQVAQNMGYFIATGHGIGWDPQQEDLERLARDWREFRPEVLAGP